MFQKRSSFRVLMLLLVLVGLLGLPMAAAAQTATGAPPTNGIKTPEDGSTVGGIVKVVGYANTENFLKWQLDLLPGGKADQAIWLANGLVPGAFTYDLVTGPFPAGRYDLRLRAVKMNGNYDEYINKLTFAGAPATPSAGTAAATTPAIAATAPVTATAVIKATAPVTATAAAAAVKVADNVNGIKSPLDGATVGGIIDVLGYANSPDFKRWQIDLLPGGDASKAIFLVTDTGAGALSTS